MTHDLANREGESSLHFIVIVIGKLACQYISQAFLGKKDTMMLYVAKLYQGSQIF